jgi:integrase
MLNAEWQACLIAFLRSFSRSNSPDSIRYYESILRYFFRTLDKEPSQVTRQDVEAFLWRPVAPGRRHAGEEPAAATRNGRLSVVASFYRYASDYVPDGSSEPLFTGKMPTMNIKAVKPAISYRAMSPDEVTRFFAIIDRETLIGKRDYALFLTYYLTARRLREIADLCYGDIEWAIILDGQERRGAWVYRFRGKGHKGQVDSAELSRLAKDAIDDYLNASGRLPLAPDDPLFFAIGTRTTYAIPHDPYAHLSSTAILQRMKTYAHQAGLDARRLSPHSWRHTAAQQRLALGQDIVDVSKLLRHKRLDNTMRYVYGLITAHDPGIPLMERAFLKDNH